MNLVDICDTNFERVFNANIEDTFDDVMKGNLGNFSGKQHLNVDESVQPIIMPDRRVPISLHPKLKAELDRLIEQGVIIAQDEPTPWLSQLVVASKKMVILESVLILESSIKHCSVNILLSQFLKILFMN